ncbi:GSCOCG00003157001-RA-CDS [Cotesia congregata]|nr:GSCOCG00003157001-RA-CDS [Cotesia congregata]
MITSWNLESQGLYFPVWMYLEVEECSNEAFLDVLPPWQDTIAHREEQWHLLQQEHLKELLELLAEHPRPSSAVMLRDLSYIFKPHDREDDIWERRNLFDVTNLADSKIYLNPSTCSQCSSHKWLDVNKELMFFLIWW